MMHSAQFFDQVQLFGSSGRSWPEGAPVFRWIHPH